MKQPNRRRLSSTAHRGEQGMAMLLVLLLIVMVTAAGVFASQSTASEIRSSGFFRQSAQTHYVAETGIIAPLDEMKTYCSAYVGIMRQRAQGTATPAGLAEPPLTYPFYLDDFNNRVSTGSLFATPANAGGSSPEGSLGVGALAPGFRSDVTVVAEESRPQFGFSVGGGRDFYVPIMSILFESNAETILRGTTDRSITVGGNVQAQEQARVVANVPCL